MGLVSVRFGSVLVGFVFFAPLTEFGDPEGAFGDVLWATGPTKRN